MQKGAELVARKASEICTDCPAVFTGDFNVTPESAPCKAVKDGGFVDSRDVAEITDKDNTFHAWLGEEKYRSVIDYVFVKGDVKVKKFLNNVLQEELEPIRERRKMFEKDIPEIYNILKKGSDVARETAAQTLDEVKSAMRINYFEDKELIKAQAAKYEV